MSLINVDSVADSQGGVLAPISSVMRNRIINGAMTIDQRGGTITVNTAVTTYGIDRWAGAGRASAGVYTFRQTTNSPVGFNNGLFVDVTTADASLATDDLYAIQQRIEGYNIADLGWGTANAKTVTLSFWVRSNLTGTFGGSITNSAFDRSYPFSYTVSVADTWEQKTVTIAGDTTGTWLTTNGVGMRMYFSLGAGATYSGTAGSWAGAGYTSSTGATNVMASTSNDFYITGVQLERGTQATSFEYRQYGQELALCQRYYYRVQGSGTGATTFGIGYNQTTTASIATTFFPVTMRDRPTALEQSGTAADYNVGHANTQASCSVVPAYASATSKDQATTSFTVASGLTAGQGSRGASASGNSNAYLAWSAEL